jgi:hypothetical protein
MIIWGYFIWELALALVPNQEAVNMESLPQSAILDCGHDGWLCTFTIKQQLEIPSARSLTDPVRATGTVRKSQELRPVHHEQNHTCRAIILQPARKTAVLDQSSSLWILINVTPLLGILINLQCIQRIVSFYNIEKFRSRILFGGRVRIRML